MELFILFLLNVIYRLLIYKPIIVLKNSFVLKFSKNNLQNRFNLVHKVEMQKLILDYFKVGNQVNIF